MHLKAVMILTFLGTTLTLYSQKNEEQQLLDTATKYSGLFVNAKPLSVHLDMSRIFLYNEWLYEQRKTKLPDSLYLQFIKNSNKADTTYWTEEELPKFVIVRGKYELLDFQSALRKFPNADSFFIKRLSSQIERYNKTQPLDRVVYHYSRPVFDNSKQYALVQYDNGHSMLMGGGGIKLYHLQQGVWKELAFLIRWSY